MSEVLRVDAEKLQAAVAAIMEKEGVAPQDAAIVADSLVSAELTGLQSHGVQRVKFYTDSMEAGGTDPRCRIKTIRDFPGGALLDAQGALGIVAAYRAMELAIQKAKDVGIGIVNVHNSNHCSCTAYYIRMAAKENMLAIVSSNAPKSMAPWGSREKYLGTNPLAVGAPTHGDPVMIDMATAWWPAARSSWPIKRATPSRRAGPSMWTATPPRTRPRPWRAVCCPSAAQRAPASP